jgi:hypothetical protein
LSYKESLVTYQNPLRQRFGLDFFATLPSEPGVYFMRSRTGEILYIGKAKSLRARLLSYRHARPGGVGDHIIALLRRVRSIDWELCQSEARALVRERELIRAVVPTFNVADAWPEEYLFIGLRGTSDELHFRLTDEPMKAAGFDLHGCYPHRRLAKSAYAALLRLLHATAESRERFAFPALLCRRAPAYNFCLKIPRARRWRRLVSAFLHGHDTALLPALVQGLLANPCVPPYVRPGLQRDLATLGRFAASGPARGELVSQEGLRERIRASVVRAKV